MKKLSMLSVLILTLTPLFAQPAFNPDSSFADVGKAVYSLNPAIGYDNATDLAIQADGKIVMVGNSRGGNDDWGVIRLEKNGNIDETFATNGVYRKSLQTSQNENATAVEIQSDGKIVIAGVTRNTTTSLARFALVRLTESGAEDPDFGTNGVVISDFGTNNECFAVDMAILNDGKILVGGHIANSDYDFIVARYQSDGSIDSTFGTNGFKIVNVGAGDVARSLHVQSDGKILMSGQYNPGGGQLAAVVRMNEDGSMDSTFASDGIGLFNIAGGSIDAGYSVRQRKSGKIVVSGWYGGFDDSDNSFVLGLKEDGSIDSSFATNGLYTSDFGNGFRDQFLSSTVLDNGTIVSVGFKSGTANIATRDFLVSMLTEDGIPVNNFGTDGSAGFDFRSTADACLAVRESPDKKIVLGGYSAKTAQSTSYDFFAVQLVQDEAIITSDTSSIHFPLNGYATEAENQVTGTLNGNVIATTDRFGKRNGAYYFDGAAHIDYGDVPEFQFGSNSFSISVWFNPNENPGGGSTVGYILGKRAIQAPEPVYSIVYNHTANTVGIYWHFDSGNGTYTTVPNVNPGWHHVVYSFDRSDNTMKLWLNNELVINESVTGFTSNPNLETFNVTGGNFMLGKDYRNNEYFTGSIDEVWVFQRVLTTEEIEALYDGAYTVSVRDALVQNPEQLLVAQNYPNPFNPSTVIEYNIPELSSVTVKVFDLLGREIATLVNGNRQVGLQSVTFNAAGLSSGLYFYQVRAGNHVITRKMMLSK